MTDAERAADFRAEADRLEAYLAGPLPHVPEYLAPGDRGRIQTRALTLREKADEIDPRDAVRR